MRRIISLLLSCLVLDPFEVLADCILSGKCDDNYVTIVDGPPMKGHLSEEALKILENRCPDLYDGSMNV